jgi:pimeloyl-ACP methyl ester carboxylesterase
MFICAVANQRKDMTNHTISYDASQQALTQPGARPTLLGHEIVNAGGSHAFLVECCRLAYLRFEDPTDPSGRPPLKAALGAVGITSVGWFSDEATQTDAFGAVMPGAGAVISFRGTDPESAANIATDLDAVLVPWPGNGRVHAGFLLAFNGLRPSIEKWMHDEGADPGALVIVGHSLGAALATLAAAAWKAPRLLTIGSPRVGDADFVSLLGQTEIVRYVNCCDVVTRLPPQTPGLFADTAPARYIDSAGDLQPTWSSAQIEADRAAARERYLVDSAWIRGNVIARVLADHAPINYLRALVN